MMSEKRFIVIDNDFSKWVEDTTYKEDKHENKCKGCRFEMIDVEDPLWEYGSPLKRVLIDNQTGETYDSVSKIVGLLNELETKCHKLEEENEQLKNRLNNSIKEHSL